MQRASLAVLALAGSAAIPFALAQVAAAQEQDPIDPEAQQSTITATISQSIETDSNYGLDDDLPGQTNLADTRLGFQLDRSSDTQRFSLGFDTGITALWEADEDYDTEVASPSTAFFTILNEGPNTTFDADVSARIREVDFDDPLTQFEGDGEVVPDTLEELEGETREERYDANIGFAIGTNSPSTYSFRFIGSSIDYSDSTDDADLVPRTTLEGQGQWALRLTPVLSSAIFGAYTYYDGDDDDETEVRIIEGDAGFIYEPNDILELQAGIGYADREREELVDGDREVTESDSGPVVRGEFRYLLPFMTLQGDIRWTTAAPDSRTAFTLRGNYQLARGRLVGRVFNRQTGGQGGDEQRVTGAGIGIIRDINEVSRVGLDLNYAYQENLDDEDDPDITRTDVEATYAYDLTETVSAELGYRYRTREEGDTDADSHRVSLVFAKTFQSGF